MNKKVLNREKQFQMKSSSCELWIRKTFYYYSAFLRNASKERFEEKLWGGEIIKLDEYENILIGFAREIVFYLQKSGASKAEAEDVVQDVFVKMLETDLVIPAEKMRAWMYRVSIRRYIDRYRRDQHYLEILQKEFFKQDVIQPFENDHYELLRSTIEELPTKEAMLLDLYYFQNFTVKEIAQIMSYSVSKVKVQLMRSRIKLRHKLEKKGYKNGNI